MNLDSETLAEEQSFYEYYATPLKPAALLKSQHLSQIKEFLKFTEIQEQCNRASALMPDLLGSKESVSASDKDFLQETLGFSDETMLQIYEKAVVLMEAENFTDASCLLIFLTCLAPYVPSYWIAEGLCFQSLNRHEEAVAAFMGAFALDEKNKVPLHYAMESSLALNDGARVRELKKMMQ